MMRKAKIFQCFPPALPSGRAELLCGSTEGIFYLGQRHATSGIVSLCGTEQLEKGWRTEAKQQIGQGKEMRVAWGLTSGIPGKRLAPLTKGTRRGSIQYYSKGSARVPTSRGRGHQ